MLWPIPRQELCPQPAEKQKAFISVRSHRNPFLQLRSASPVSTELVPSSHIGQSYSIQGKRSCWTQRFKAAALLPYVLARSLTVPEENEVVRSLR